MATGSYASIDTAYNVSHPDKLKKRLQEKDLKKGIRERCRDRLNRKSLQCELAPYIDSDNDETMLNIPINTPVPAREIREIRAIEDINADLDKLDIIMAKPKSILKENMQVDPPINQTEDKSGKLNIPIEKIIIYIIIGIAILAVIYFVYSTFFKGNNDSFVSNKPKIII